MQVLLARSQLCICACETCMPAKAHTLITTCLVACEARIHILHPHTIAPPVPLQLALGMGLGLGLGIPTLIIIGIVIYYHRRGAAQGGRTYVSLE
jgi:hypothetical protein